MAACWVGVVTFPGTLDDRDAARAVALAGAEPVRLWHGDADLHGVDAVVLPGGFSYGDYLRCGAIARFAPVMDDDRRRGARDGLPVLGICNGFQILCEAHLLPGALTRNDAPALRQPGPAAADRARGHGLDQRVTSRARRSSSRSRTARAATSPTTARWTSSRPRAGSWPATSAATPTARSATSPAITNEAGNVVGIMPHPEHAVEAADRPGAPTVSASSPRCSRPALA